MFNFTVHASGREFAGEVTGSFDSNNFAGVDMTLEDEAAFVGSGRTVRGAVENCVHHLAGTPYEGYQTALDRETQIVLESFAGSDEGQGDRYICVIKVKA